MSEHGNELKKALSENGNFDAEKAGRDATEANSYFDSQLRRHARITWLSMIFVIAVLECAFVGFVLTFSTKALVGFAIVLVVTVVLIGMVSTWYEITNTKISLLREIKLLRLEHLGLPPDRTIQPAREAARTSTSLWRVLSLRENMAWLLTLILIAAVTNYSTLQLMTWGTTMTDESRVTLLPDGSGLVVNKVSYRYQGFLPMTSASLWSGDPSYAITQWLDGQGRDLPISVSTIGGERRFTVQFAEPIIPGDHVSYQTTAEGSKMATKNGETWTFHGGQKWGGEGRKYFLQTIRLPPEARIVSVEPKPSQQSVQDGSEVLRFQAVVDQDHELRYAIQYRFPKENGAEKAAK
jgi:hypothetical protein